MRASRTLGRARRLLLLALLVPAVLAVAGCGDDRDAKNAYVERVTQAQNAYAAQLERLAPAVTKATGLDPQGLQRLQAATESYGRQLRAVTPPDGVARLHAELDGYAEALARAKDAAGTPGTAAVTALTDATSQVSTSMTATLVAIGRKLRS